MPSDVSRKVRSSPRRLGGAGMGVRVGWIALQPPVGSPAIHFQPRARQLLPATGVDSLQSSPATHLLDDDRTGKGSGGKTGVRSRLTNQCQSAPDACFWPIIHPTSFPRALISL